MRKLVSYFLIGWSLLSCSTGEKNDGVIRYEQVQLTASEKQTLKESLAAFHPDFDPAEAMITSKLNSWNYHTDALTGNFHQVRGSFNYAVMLLDMGDEQYLERALKIIEKTISLQDQDLTSKSCGVWPYFMEEPLATKKAPIDYNWADFNAVSLLEVWMGHSAQLPERLKEKIKQSLILAAKSIQKRNVGSDYTNIAIMGTYVTYVTSQLFDLPEMKEYARKRLQRFYDYTLDKGGFSEYNSPTYTITALDELNRMERHIVEPAARKMIDSLYSIGWDMIARHYHPPTGQWTGPHSRAYTSLVNRNFYSILKEASNGQIVAGIGQPRSDVKIKHHIPGYLMHYFLTPEYPRSEVNVFEKVEPGIVGTTYLTDKFALSTANRSGLWNQRRPFLVYWGDAQSPKYLQVRFLHDDYDFSSASFYSQQKENKALAIIGFITNGGDKHINIDRLKDGKFKAKDLRLRFEFGNILTPEVLITPKKPNEPFTITLDQLKFNLQLYCADFDHKKGRWKKGGNGKASWIDYVFYADKEREFDLTKIERAIAGFTFSIVPSDKNQAIEKAEISESGDLLKASWSSLKIELPLKPQTPKNPFF